MHRVLDRAARVNAHARILLAQQHVATDVVEMPVAVDDRDDRLLRGTREIDDLLRVLGMPAGVEDDEAVGRREHDRVAVRLRAGAEPARNQIDTRRQLARTGETGQGRNTEDHRNDAHWSSSPFARRLSLRRCSYRNAHSLATRRGERGAR